MYYLAIDIGASSGRHIIGSYENGRIVTEELYRFPNGMQKNESGTLVWDTESLFHHIKAGIKACVDAGKSPDYIGIDSWGGDLVACYTIINAIELSKTPVWTISIGAAYSAGFFIYIAGHKRFAYPHASYLYHEGSTAAKGEAHKYRNQADFYKKQLDQLKAHTLKYTKLSEADYERILKDDYWLTAPEAVEQGIVDVILTEGIL